MALVSSCSPLCHSSPSMRCTRKSAFYESCTVLSDGRDKNGFARPLAASSLVQIQWLRRAALNAGRLAIHSVRTAVIGSTLVARLAGIQLARIVVAPRTPKTERKIGGSNEL